MQLPANQIGIGHRIVHQGLSFVVSYSYTLLNEKDEEIIVLESKDHKLKVVVKPEDMITLFQIKRKGSKKDGRTI